MSTQPSLYIGLISGTSVDGIDAVLVDFSSEQPVLIGTHCHPISQKLRDSITALCAPSISTNEIDLLGKTDNTLGEAFADAAITLLDKMNISAKNICAIGSHGQTVRHRPGNIGFTLQIADPNVIAERTGITTISDFRRRDMAAGGQGAPFAPAFHRAITPPNKPHCAFLNLGGIANITIIENGELICGYDTGPANGLMDAWSQRHLNLPFDQNGDWAASGDVEKTLLAELASDPYFELKAPKSTGREYFNLEWLQSRCVRALDTIAPENVQATLLALSIKTVCDEILRYKIKTVYCCGGGVHNHHLMAALKHAMGEVHVEVTDTSELGIAPDWIEAAAFAWLAKKHMQAEPVDLRAVTGANKACILGTKTG